MKLKESFYSLEASQQQENSLLNPVPAPIDIVRAKLTRNHNSINYFCPVHDDSSPSLSVKEGQDGRVVLFCHAGCETEDVLRAIGLVFSDLFPSQNEATNQRIGRHPQPPIMPSRATSSHEIARYDYTDENGTLLYRVIRYSPKSFRQCQANGQWSVQGVRKVLYQLPSIIESVSLGKTIHLTEGERDTDALREKGFAATTIAGGANATLTQDIAEPLRGASIVIHADNDESGRRCAQIRASILSNLGVGRIRIVEYNDLPEHGDVTDFLASVESMEVFEQRIECAQDWRPQGALPSDLLEVYSLADLLDTPELLNPPIVVVPHIAFRGRLTLLAAREKSGKSTFISEAASAVSQGHQFLGTRVSRGNVLHIALEEHRADLARRYQQLEADRNGIYIAEFLPNGIESLKDAIQARLYSLVIIDTLSALLSACGVDDFNSAAKILPVMMSLIEITRSHDVALVLLHHASKATGKYRDSTAIGGAVDMIAQMQDPENRDTPTQRDFKIKGRVPSRDFSVQFDEGHYSIASTTTSHEMRIIDLLRSQPRSLSKTAIRAEIRGGSNKIDDALRSLIARGIIQKDSRGYSLFSNSMPYFGDEVDSREVDSLDDI